METWSALPFAEWKGTCETLHMWTQVVGKLKLSHTPFVNHWWNAALQVTARGLTTGVMYQGARAFQAEFDFLDHQLVLADSSGDRAMLPLGPMTVADFYGAVRHMLHGLGIQPHIWSTPAEIPDPLPFEQDTLQREYDAQYAQRFWRALLSCERVLGQFRAGFVGKSSDVLFYWGGFDIAVTRFTGRTAPPREDEGVIIRRTMTHEEASFGLWFGGDGEGPVFYAYAYPEPDGFGQSPVSPPEATYSDQMHEFLLPYAAVREASDPDAVLLGFLQSTYDAAAKLGKWDPALLLAG